MKRLVKQKILSIIMIVTMIATLPFTDIGTVKAKAETNEGLVLKTPCVTVTGTGITNNAYDKNNVSYERSYTLDELKDLSEKDPTTESGNKRYVYSAINTRYTKSKYIYEGVRIDKLLENSGVNKDTIGDNKIMFTDGGYKSIFDPQKTEVGSIDDANVTGAFFKTRYYYPEFGSVSEANKVEIPSLIIWAKGGNKGVISPEPNEVGPTNLSMAVGQLAPNDCNNPLYCDNPNTIQVGDKIEETVLEVNGTKYTRKDILQMSFAEKNFTYETKGGDRTEFVRGVPLSQLLKGCDESDVVNFYAADNFECTENGKTVKELIDNNYILAYEKGENKESLSGIYEVAKADVSIHGFLTLYGDGAKPSKLINNVTSEKKSEEPVDFSKSNFKHITNGGKEGDSPYNIDAITGATLTVEGPGVKTSVPVSVRTLENQNDGEFRGEYTDNKNGTKLYEGIRLSYLLKDMPKGDNIQLTDKAYSVKIKNRAKQTIATFTLSQIEEAEQNKKPILISYGVGDGTIQAPFVFDGGSGIIESLKNDDGCLKLVYDKEAITGDNNTEYKDFGNMAYIYVEEASTPGYKHTGDVYGKTDTTNYIITLNGSGMGREVNLTLDQIEKLVNEDSADIEKYDSNEIGFRKEYSLTNTTMWKVNAYEGVKLYNLLNLYGLKNDLSADTQVNFTASDGYVSNAKFTVNDLLHPELFGYYEKNALDNNDGKYLGAPGDKKGVGYPIVLAFGVNGYPYVKSTSDSGYVSGLENSGGPLRVIFGKKQYIDNNGSNQLQKVENITVGDGNVKYNTHKYNSDDVYTKMAQKGANDLKITVQDTNGTTLNDDTYSLGDVEDLIYGKDVSKSDAIAAKGKAYYQFPKGSKSYSDLYEGVNLEYLMKDVLQIPGQKGNVTFSDGEQSLTVELEDLYEKGSNTETKVDGLSSVLVFAKNGYPTVKDSDSEGFVKEYKLLYENSKVTVKNDMGALSVIIPGSKDGEKAPRGLKNVTSIKVELSADKYAHTDDEYSSLAKETIKISGEGISKTQAQIFSVLDLEGKQKLAITGDYTLQNEETIENTRFRGLKLYEFLRSTDVGLKPGAKDVIISGKDSDGKAAKVTLSIADIMNKTGYIDELPVILAYGSSDVNNLDKEDGKPLVKNKADKGYDEKYHNDNGPVRLIINPKNKEDNNALKVLNEVTEIEITKVEVESAKHNISDIYKTYENDKVTFVVRKQDGTELLNKEYTVEQLEAMDQITISDSYTSVGVHNHDGIDLWSFIKQEAGNINKIDTPTAVKVYSGPKFSKDVLSIWDLDQLKNGIKDSADSSIRKKIILAYSQDQAPLVKDISSDGYLAASLNAGGPIKLLTHENQSACVKCTDKVEVTVGNDAVVETGDAQVIYDSPNAGIRNIVSDKEGGVWIGTYGGGFIHKLSDGSSKEYKAGNDFSANFVSAIAADNNGGVWFTQNASYTQPEKNAGVCYMDKNGNFTSYTVEKTPGTIPNNYVQSIFIDKDNVVWFGSFGGLTSFDGTNWKTYTKENGLPAESVDVIVSDGQGGLWVGCYPDSNTIDGVTTYKGGYAHLLKNGQMITYNADDNKDVNNTLLADEWVRSIATDSIGGTWVVYSGSYSNLENPGGRIDYVTNDGNVLHYTGKQLLPNTLNNNHEVRTITVDEKNGLWFGTSGNGIIYSKAPGEVTKVYDVRNAGWNNTSSYDNIYSTTLVNEDNKTKIYVGSNGGASVMDVSSVINENKTATTIQTKNGNKEFTYSTLKLIQMIEGNVNYTYSSINTSANWSKVENAAGPSIKGILKAAGININDLDDNTNISFVASDGYKVGLTKGQLTKERYYFPNGNKKTENGGSGDESSREGKIIVPAVLDLNNGNGTLTFGQTEPNEQNKQCFNKYVAEGGSILVGMSEATKLIPITAIKYKGGEKVENNSTVNVGSILEFEIPSDNKDAKIYYTVDGSEPTMASTMYNYTATKYGNNYNDITLNKAGKITIKAVVMDNGRLQSNVATFTLTVKDYDKNITNTTVTGVSISDKTYNSITIKWEKNDEATKYKIYRATSKNGVYSYVYYTNKYSFTDKKVTTGKTYYYKVVATNSHGKSKASGYVYTKASPYMINGSYVHNYGRKAFKIGWNKQSGVTGYRVYKATSKYGTYECIATVRGDKNTSYIDKNVKSKKTYYYKVRAYKAVSGKMIFGSYSGIKYRTR